MLLTDAAAGSNEDGSLVPLDGQTAAAGAGR
jgi:hypothetical protein